MAFKKGQSGNPKGRPARTSSHFVAAITENRAKFRSLIIAFCGSPKLALEERARNPGVDAIELMVISIIERIINDGDMQKMKMLMEIALGRLIDENEEYDAEEKLLILAYRQKKEEHERSIATSSTSPSGEA